MLRYVLIESEQKKSIANCHVQLESDLQIKPRLINEIKVLKKIYLFETLNSIKTVDEILTKESYYSNCSTLLLGMELNECLSRTELCISALMDKS